MSCPKAFVILFKDLHVWSVGSFFKLNWQWPSEYIKPLSSALKRKSVVANNEDYLSGQMKLVTLHFDGTIVPRATNGRNDFKGNLYSAASGDVLYSKIDVRNGAIGIVPEDMTRVAVSSEFPVYEVNPELAFPQYIRLLFRTRYFRQAINSMISGTSGRKRVQPPQLEALEVPLPPLSIQQAIVERWQNSQEEIDNMQNNLKQLEKGMFLSFQNEIGRANTSAISKPKAFILGWKDIDRWGVDISWKQKNRFNTAKFTMSRVEQLCEIGSGGTPLRQKPAYFNGGIPWVKTAEVRNNIIMNTEETITKLGLNNSSAKIYPVGSIIVAMYGQGATRGRTAKLGISAATNQACAVLSNFDERIEPDYLWIYLMSEYERLRDLASGNNQPNLNADMIANYPVPLPPLEIQKEIIKQVKESQLEIARERETAEKKSLEIKAEIEALVLGTKRIDI